MMELKLKHGICYFDDSDEDVVRDPKRHWYSVYRNGAYEVMDRRTGELLPRVLLGITSKGIWARFKDGNRLNNQRNNIEALSGRILPRTHIVCCSCKVEKSIENFSLRKDGKSVDYRRTKCIDCMRKYLRDYVKRHARKMAAQQRKRTKNYHDNIKTWFCEYLTDKKCKDCGYNNILALEFDHVNNDKEANVCRLISKRRPKNIIMAEINKCDIVCANCHRIRTQTRANTYKVRWLSASKTENVPGMPVAW